MEERSTFFVELPNTTELKERGVALGESLKDFAAQAATSVAFWACCAATTLSTSLSSLVSREDSWNDFRDKCRPWLLGFGIALVLFFGITFVSSAIISARYPRHTQQLHLHAGHYDSHQSQPRSEPQTQSHLHSLSQAANHTQSGVTGTQAPKEPLPMAHQNHGTSAGSSQGVQEQAQGSGSAESADSEDSILAAALESEALQLPGKAPELGSAARSYARQRSLYDLGRSTLRLLSFFVPNPYAVQTD